MSWRQLLDDRRQVRVSAIGERRATAYTMTNLIVRHKHRLLFTWQDQPITNALGRCDEDGSQARVLCVLGLPSDDHGNAALALDTQGRLHALIGAHHGPLLHRVCDDPEKPHAWRDVAELGAKATHPSLVCDRRGTLHLTYRSSVNNPGRWTTSGLSRTARGANRSLSCARQRPGT